MGGAGVPDTKFVSYKKGANVMKKTSEKLTDIIPPPVVARVRKDNTIEIVGIDKVMKEDAETPDAETREKGGQFTRTTGEK